MGKSVVCGEMPKGDLIMVLTDEEIKKVRELTVELQILLNKLDDTPLPFNEHEAWGSLKRQTKKFNQLHGIWDV